MNGSAPRGERRRSVPAAVATRPAVAVALAIVSLGSVVSALAQAPEGGPVTLPPGEGKLLVEGMCLRCHGAEVLATSGGYSRDGWAKALATMLVVPEDKASVLLNYLGEHFPVRPMPEAVEVHGSEILIFREWPVPTLGSLPHDPLAARDGSLWWTARRANVLGRLDPATGAMREFQLPSRESGPQGLVEDSLGSIWYTGITNDRIGRLDPTSGVVTEFDMPGSKPRGPHTPVFDGKGRLWFTLQSGMVGRLEPTTGTVQLATAPTAGSSPQGIAIDSRGVPWYADANHNRIGSVDPERMTIREYVLPDKRSRPRRLALTADDAVWYTDHARGHLGRFDPRTRKSREWRSPGGPASRPYGITAVGTVIWYSESGVRPNTLVRFDTRTEKFQAFLIPSGVGPVRHIAATARGDLVLALGGSNGVALVQVGSLH